MALYFWRTAAMPPHSSRDQKSGGMAAALQMTTE